MLVAFLVGMVSLVLLKALNKDFERIAANEDDPEVEMEKMIEETGWKRVSVFFVCVLVCVH